MECRVLTTTRTYLPNDFQKLLSWLTKCVGLLIAHILVKHPPPHTHERKQELRNSKLTDTLLSLVTTRGVMTEL